jgi:hypothetical protein
MKKKKTTNKQKVYEKIKRKLVEQRAVKQIRCPSRTNKGKKKNNNSDYGQNQRR